MSWFTKRLFRKLLLITGGGTTLLVASALTGLWWIHGELVRVGAVRLQGAAFAQHLADALARADRALVVTLALMAASVAVAFVYFLIFSRRSIVAPAGALVADLERLANGEFDRAVSVHGADEFGLIGQAAERLRLGLGTLIAQVAGRAQDLGGQAQQLDQTAGRSLESVSAQRADIDQVATAMAQMAASVQEVARSAQASAEAAQHGRDLSQAGASVAGEAITAIRALGTRLDSGNEVMDRLRAAADEIGGVLEVIARLAEQTNLLALNAAIEAARAGEHGRGFAVVAGEVRSLSQQTHASTERIRTAVERIQGGSTEAVKAMRAAGQAAREGEAQVERTAEALSEVTTTVSTVSDVAAQIASAAEEQSTVAAEIDRNVTSLAEGGHRTEDAASEVRRYAESLRDLAAALSAQAGRFRLEDRSATP